MLRLLADAGSSVARSLGLYLLVFVGLPLLVAAISLVWRLGRRLPDVDGDPQAVLEHPGRFVESVGARRFVRELVSPLSLSVVAVSFAAPALATGLIVGDSQQDEGTVNWITRNLWWLAGLAGVLLIGRWAAADIASRRARRYANSRLQAALRECWRRERSLIGSWGRRHDLAPIERLGFTQGLDTTPILLEGMHSDYGNPLRGSLEGTTATFFHLTQLGDFAGRPPPGENEASEPAFRWLTCVHMKRRPRDLVMTLRPRRAQAPPCGLNEVPLEAVGEAWRSSTENGDATLDVASLGDEEGPRVEVLERLVDSGRLPPRALELRGEWDAAAPEERKRLRRQISREILAWRADDRAPALGLGRALSDRGWRSIRFESVAFNERYELRTKDRDDLEVVGIFDPAFIVEVTEQLQADLLVELHDANLLVAIPGRVVDEEILDELLVTADHLGRHVDESPLPA